MGKRGGCFVLGTVLLVVGVALVYVSESRHLDVAAVWRTDYLGKAYVDYASANRQEKSARGLALMYGVAAVAVGGGLVVAGLMTSKHVGELVVAGLAASSHDEPRPALKEPRELKLVQEDPKESTDQANQGDVELGDTFGVWELLAIGVVGVIIVVAIVAALSGYL